MALVSTQWLADNLNKVKILDSSWHMPSTNRDGYKEYKKEHIVNSIFFDIDKNSNQNTDLPHMLPEKKTWEKIVSEMGISNNDKIIIYDNSDVISACRCWYQFLYFGHKPELIFVLNGGLKKWKQENRKTINKNITLNPSNYIASEKFHLVKSRIEIDENIKKNKFKLVDARSRKRFLGLEKEPRHGVKNGSIPNSQCLPFVQCLNLKDNTFLDRDTLKEKFESIGIKNDENVVFTCGSGITASVLGLAYSIINDKYVPKIYDGSWSEYGRVNENEKIN